MRTLFSTHGVPARAGFRLWREMLCERFVLSEQTALVDKPFDGRLEATAVGDLGISRITLDPARSELREPTIRRRGADETIIALFLLEGRNGTVQNGRESAQRGGDIVVIDTARPLVLTSTAVTSSFLVEVPRRRLEDALGPARLYSSLTLDGALAAASLATTFFKDLVRVQGDLDRPTAVRMASVGVDLVAAAVAERLAREVPLSIHGDVVVQRAKAYVEANLADPRLAPVRVAAVAGVSLRRLQELFQERGRAVAEWIWERRLERASVQLADPGCGRLSVASVAFGCGFASQAHFATRFKRHFGLTPRDYRVWASMRRAEAPPDGTGRILGPDGRPT